MAKAAYRGVNNVARKSKKIYRGVNAVARKVKNGYRGVNGVARKFYAAVQPTILSNGLLYQKGTHYATWSGTATNVAGYYIRLYDNEQTYAEWKNISLYGYARVYTPLDYGLTWKLHIQIYNSDGVRIVNYLGGNTQSSSISTYFSQMGFTPVQGEAYTIRISDNYNSNNTAWPLLTRVQFYAS